MAQVCDWNGTELCLPKMHIEENPELEANLGYTVRDSVSKDR